MPDPDFKTMIETIRDHNEITEVIGSYIQLKKSGSSIKACCPFHKEKTPSFNVSPTRQTFHCFGCGAGGDVFNFIMRYENLDFMGAARRLAERANLAFTFERDGKGSPTATSNKDDLYKLHTELAAWYQRCLKESGQAEKARTYLEERDLDPATVEQFGIGYAPARDMKWEDWAKRRNIPMDILMLAGILIKKDEGGWYDRFADRLMFPIQDELGRVIGFSGRILPGDTRPAKYVNSPETPLFTKSKVIYALHHAKREILDRKEAVLCEGQIDVIRCHLAGIRNAVAAQGTAITPQHASILKRFTDTVRLVLDSDDAGKNAALRSGDTLTEAGLHVRVASLAQGEDPDSMIRRGGAPAFMAAIDAAPPFLEFKIGTLLEREKSRDDAAIMRTARAVAESIARVPSDIQRDQWIQRAGTLLGVRPDILASEIRQMARRMPKSTTDEQSTASVAQENQPALPVYPREELELLRLLIQHPASANLLRHYVMADHFTSGICREIYTRCLEHADDEHFDLMAELLACHEETRRLAAMLIAENKFSGDEFDPDRTAQDLIIALHKRQFDQRRRELEARRKNATGEALRELNMEISEITLHQHTLRSGWQKARLILSC